MRKHREFLLPDLTPLIDVVFLLLIFFLVTSVFKKEDMALLLNLPKSSYSTQEVNTKDINIFVTPEKINFENKEVSFEDLEQVLSEVIDKNKLINVRIDKEVKYQRVMNILDILKKYELTNLALVNEKQE
jgi:biopolymer transport protein ExbD